MQDDDGVENGKNQYKNIPGFQHTWPDTASRRKYEKWNGDNVY